MYNVIILNIHIHIYVYMMRCDAMWHPPFMGLGTGDRRYGLGAGAARRWSPGGHESGGVGECIYNTIYNLYIIYSYIYIIHMFNCRCYNFCQISNKYHLFMANYIIESLPTQRHSL